MTSARRTSCAATGSSPTPTLAVGERIVHEDASGDRRAGRVVKLLDEDAAAVVAFDRSGQTAVAIERLEREAA